MNSRELLILAMYYCDGLMRGKTLLQKRMYFIDTYLKILLENEDLPDLGFIPYYYGPYSPLLNEDLLLLREGGFVEEKSTESDSIRKRYDYFLADKGKEKAKEIAKAYSSISKLLKPTCNFLINKASDDYQLLSWAAKTHFLLSRTDKPLNISNIKSQAKDKVHWEISEEQISKAVKLLTDFKLVSTD